MINYSFETWFIANLIHPLIMFIGLLFFDSYVTNFIFTSEGFGVFFLFSVLSFVFSFPLLLLDWVIIKYIVRADLTPGARLFVWTLLTPVQLLMVACVIAISTDKLTWMSLMEIILFFLPSMLASCFAILMRPEKFLQLLETETRNEILITETSQH